MAQSVDTKVIMWLADGTKKYFFLPTKVEKPNDRYASSDVSAFEEIEMPVMNENVTAIVALHFPCFDTFGYCDSDSKARLREVAFWLL